jgi:hypothetical protein
MPASLGPGLRTVSGAKRKRDGTLPSCAQPCLPERSPPDLQKPSLPARSPGAITPQSGPVKTVYPGGRPKGEPGVRTAVERTRRRAVDRAVGLMSWRARWTAENIVKLGESAASESVKLAALRAVLSDMMAVSKFYNEHQ